MEHSKEILENNEDLLMEQSKEILENNEDLLMEQSKEILENNEDLLVKQSKKIYVKNNEGLFDVLERVGTGDLKNIRKLTIIGPSKLGYGCDLNSKMCYSTENNDYYSILNLVENGADNFKECLQIAKENGNVKLIRFFSDKI